MHLEPAPNGGASIPRRVVTADREVERGAQRQELLTVPPDEEPGEPRTRYDAPAEHAVAAFIVARRPTRVTTAAVLFNVMAVGGVVSS